MLVVIPFHAGDRHLVLKNLELCLRWGRIEHPCLLAVDTSIDNVDDVRQAASAVFREVLEFQYAEWLGDKNWPTVQNHAWQNVARFMYVKHPADHWFWWEADAVPLSAGWVDELESEYERGKLPFMGHIVGSMGHMNGVAVYPWNVCEYSTAALLCRAAPWDVVLKQDTFTLTHKANHIMAHQPRANAVRLSVVEMRVVDDLRKTGAVIFHGCNDGTLQDMLLGNPVEVKPSALNKIFDPSQIEEEFDESQSLWEIDAIRLKSKKQGIANYAFCRKEQPPFPKQTEWESGVIPLKLDQLTCHFNAGVVRNGAGQLWLLARRWDRRSGGIWNSTMVACLLDEKDMSVRQQIDLRPPRLQAEQYEDPRVVWAGNRYWVTHCSWKRNYAYAAKQLFSVFNSEWRYIGGMHIPYGKNGREITNACEKNWLFFHHDGAWHFVYSANPHVVVRVNSERDLMDYKTEPVVPWNYGEIRGGTPPVRVGDEYLTFMHSSLPWKGRQKRYYMGAYTFEAKPPFRVTGMTTEPLLCGSEQDSRTLGGPVVIFPCGALHENGRWLVTFGVNDEQVGWVKIPHEELIRRMTRV